jgi:hypothetical protein
MRLNFTIKGNLTDADDSLSMPIYLYANSNNMLITINPGIVAR